MEEFKVENVRNLRLDMIILRDNALKANDFAWAVTLSHLIKLMSAVITDHFKESIE